jgi:hypothetical protein
LSLRQTQEGLGDGGVGNDTWRLFGDSTDGFAWPTEFSPSTNLTRRRADQDQQSCCLAAKMKGSFLPLE